MEKMEHLADAYDKMWAAFHGGPVPRMDSSDMYILYRWIPGGKLTPPRDVGEWWNIAASGDVGELLDKVIEGSKHEIVRVVRVSGRYMDDQDIRNSIHLQRFHPRDEED